MAGELKKITRNKVFLVAAAAILAANLITVLYCSEIKSESYYEYRQEEQQQYIESYRGFVDEIGSRSREILAALDADGSEFIKRNVEKTVRDYSGLGNVEPDAEYHAGVEEYAGYTYGIFFCILFSFACLEFIYFSEKRTAMIHILRTTKKGRMWMVLSKWLACLLLTALFCILQEAATVWLYGQLYPMGSLGSPVQSLRIFRDCPEAFRMAQGIAANIANRVMVSVAAGSILFFFGTVLNSAGRALLASFVILALQYIFSITISVDSMYDKLCCINLFHSWDMKNYIGVYHNLNIFGVPVEKNTVVLAMDIAMTACMVAAGSVIFSVRYQAGCRKWEWKIFHMLRRLLSKLLHIRSLFVNELYKLLFQQKKWVLVAVFVAVSVGSLSQYLPNDMYQTAEETYYHMYLSHIKGKLDDKAERFISEEEENIRTLKQQLQEAGESGDSTAYILLDAQMQGREEAFGRLTAQYGKLCGSQGAGRYFVDELDLKKLLGRYDKDVLIFMISAIALVLLVSGLFAYEKENKIASLIYSTRNGRRELLRCKWGCAVFLTAFVFLLTSLPSWNGYRHILDAECMGLKLNLLYDPAMGSGMTLAGMIAIIYLLKLIAYAGIAQAAALIARKTKDEFMTSVFVSVMVIIVCLVMYFLKTSISLIVVSIL